ncbi:hypothetical protein KY385_04340 [Candidatus Parcubacteria bacterium]|nr:hypothetical protein [Candidatus Parcubacteria bacterium]
MPKRGEITDVVDGMLKIMVFGGVASVGLLAPNAIQALDRPLQLYFKKMDKRDRQRELRKTLDYMRRNGLVRGSYEHGLQITSKGKKRLQKAELDRVNIPIPKHWDKKWRLVLFDIPETKKAGRDGLTHKIKELGFKQLQKSVWIFPHPCRGEIELVCSKYGVDRYVTYIETTHIDKAEVLKNRFKF